MGITIQESIDNLRAHYAMIGIMPSPIPERLPFEVAFARAVEVDDDTVFKALPPLLIINEWDYKKLLTEMMIKNYSRLRLLCAIADFFIDFSRKSMNPPVACDPLSARRRLRLTAAGLEEYEIPTEEHSEDKNLHPAYSYHHGEFFKDHGFGDVDWNLATFWKCYGETIKLRKESLKSPQPFDPFDL